MTPKRSILSAGLAHDLGATLVFFGLAAEFRISEVPFWVVFLALCLGSLVLLVRNLRGGCTSFARLGFGIDEVMIMHAGAIAFCLGLMASFAFDPASTLLIQAMLMVGINITLLGNAALIHHIGDDAS